MLTFFQKHIAAGIGLLVGPTIAIGSLLLHAHALVELGLPVEYWVAIGLLIFFLSVIGILITWEQEHSPAASLAVPPRQGASWPTRIPSIVGAVLSKPKPFALVPLPDGQPKDRIYVNRDPTDLMNMVEGKMGNERSRISAPFIGKWLSLSVVVDDIHISEHRGRMYVAGITLTCWFEQEWADRLDVLSKGQLVSVIGKIQEITERHMALEDCN